MVKSVAVSERHWKFLVTATKMYSDGYYLPQISLPFHQVFLHCSLAREEAFQPKNQVYKEILENPMQTV